MARKLKPHEERAFLEASPFTELAIGAKSFHAQPFRKAMDHPIFDKQLPALGHIELLVDEELGHDEWF